MLRAPDLYPRLAFLAALGTLAHLVAGAGCGADRPPPPPEGGRKVDERIAVQPGLRRADLGRVAVATFEIAADAKVTIEGAPHVMHKQQEDTMGATDAFLAELLGAGVQPVARGRREVDARLKELGHSASGLVDSDTAPSIGNELGAKTLVVGAYLLNAEGEAALGEQDVFLKPRRVFSQAVHIKGFNIETGEWRFNAVITAGEEASSGRVFPKTLAAEAAKRLLAKLP